MPGAYTSKRQQGQYSRAAVSVPPEPSFRLIAVSDCYATKRLQEVTILKPTRL
jgi:hypothetical protein